jgi:hypothetical protein
MYVLGYIFNEPEPRRTISNAFQDQPGPPKGDAKGGQ